MKKIGLNGNDIIVPDIISKQEYTQNRIKYDTRYYVKEAYNKIFLINREFKTKIAFPVYLFTLKENLSIKNGIVIVADFSEHKNIFLLGTLDNPLDTRSLLKLEFVKDKFYDDNILAFSNWVKFFADKNSPIYIATNNISSFEALIDEQNLTEFNFEFIYESELEKAHLKIKPFFIKEDIFTIYAPSILITIICCFLLGAVADEIIKADIASSISNKNKKSKELSEITKSLKIAENSEYYKNRAYYKKLSERKVYTRSLND